MGTLLSPPQKTPRELEVFLWTCTFPSMTQLLQTNNFFYSANQLFPFKTPWGYGKKMCKLKILLRNPMYYSDLTKKNLFYQTISFLCKGQLAHVSVSWGLFVLFPFWKRSGEKSQEMRVKSRWFPPGSCFECCSKGLSRQCKAVSLLIAFH